MSQQINDLRLVEAWVEGACKLEAWARKPGNVHPGRSFSDTSWADFFASAEAIAGPLSCTAGRSVGESVLEAVQKTRLRTPRNTNLGIILLLAPLCAAPVDLLRGLGAPGGREELRDWLRGRIKSLSVGDAELVYAAIRVAAPGGLGSVKEGDVGSRPTGNLLEMMRLAAERDLVARQYSGAYEEVFCHGLPALERALAAGRGLEEGIVWVFLELLARHGDSLIERKCGKEASREAADRARRVLDAGWPSTAAGKQEIELLDTWLRSDGNRRNPGTCADLVAAVLFLALAGGIISPELAHSSETLHGMQKYKVRVTKDYLTFCCAHFISFEGTQCERLHGHNYRVSAEIEAPLNDDYLVFDFIVLKNILRELANQLDHRMLVPLRSRALKVTVGDEAVEIRYNSKKWLFPKEDCALLEIENTTAELLARWISGRLREALAQHSTSVPSPPRMPEIIRVEVEESPGQSATYESVG